MDHKWYFEDPIPWWYEKMNTQSSLLGKIYLPKPRKTALYFLHMATLWTNNGTLRTPFLVCVKKEILNSYF